MKGKPRGKDSRIRKTEISQTLLLDVGLSKKFDKYIKSNDMSLKMSMMILMSWIIQRDFRVRTKYKEKRRPYAYILDREFENIISERSANAEISKNEFLVQALEKMLEELV